MSNFDKLSYISFVLSIFAVWFAYYTWTHPISNEFETVKVFEDKSGKKVVMYTYKKNRLTWQVVKIDTSAVGSDVSHKFIADRKNNPNISESFKSLKDVSILNYREFGND